MENRKTVAGFKRIRPRGCFPDTPCGHKRYLSQWNNKKDKERKKMSDEKSSVKELSSAIDSLLLKIDRVAEEEISRLQEVIESISKTTEMLKKIRAATGQDDRK